MPRNSNVEKSRSEDEHKRCKGHPKTNQTSPRSPVRNTRDGKESARERRRTRAPWTVDVERRTVSLQMSTSAQTVNPGTLQHQAEQDGHQLPVVPMGTEKHVNSVATNQRETAQRPRTSTRESTKRSSEQRVAASTSSEPGLSRPNHAERLRQSRHNRNMNKFHLIIHVL
jgi:hypothetical protein